MMNGFVRVKIKVSDLCNNMAVFRSHALLSLLAISQLSKTPSES